MLAVQVLKTMSTSTSPGMETVA